MSGTGERIMTNADFPNQHADFSPSSLQQLYLCPGAYRMQQGLEDVETPESSEGTMLHGYINGEDHELTDEQREQIDKCWAFLETNWQECDIEHETRLELRDTMGMVLTWGTADAIIKDARGAWHIIDWKFGYKKVTEAQNNLQIAAYALMLMQRENVQSVTAHIFQPRINSHSEYTFSNPEAIMRNIERIIQRCKGESLILNAGEACTYCRAKANCPAYSRAFEAVATPTSDFPSQPEKIEALWLKCQSAKKFIADVEDATKAYLEAHGTCGRLKFKETAGRREFSDNAALFEALSNEGWLSSSELLDRAKWSVTEIVNECAKREMAAAEMLGDKLTLKDAKAIVEEHLEGCISRAKPTRSIVAEE